jgi:hypothetical protein
MDMEAVRRGSASPLNLRGRGIVALLPGVWCLTLVQFHECLSLAACLSSRFSLLYL